MSGALSHYATASQTLLGYAKLCPGHGLVVQCILLCDRHRPLAPGQYVVEASSPGMANASSTVVVPVDGSGVVLSFRLVSAYGKGKVRGTERCCLPGSH